MINEKASIREDTCLPLRMPSAAQDRTRSSAISLGLIGDTERSRPKERSFYLQFLTLSIGSLESPWCHCSGFDLSLSPGLCVELQSCPLRFVGEFSKELASKARVGLLGKTASQAEVRRLMPPKTKLGEGAGSGGGETSSKQKREESCAPRRVQPVPISVKDTRVLEACPL